MSQRTRPESGSEPELGGSNITLEWVVRDQRTSYRQGMVWVVTTVGRVRIMTLKLYSNRAIG